MLTLKILKETLSPVIKRVLEPCISLGRVVTCIFLEEEHGIISDLKNNYIALSAL